MVLKLAGYISWFIVFISFKYANSILQRGKVKSNTHMGTHTHTYTKLF